MDSDTCRLHDALEATRLSFGLTRNEVSEVARAAADSGIRGICVPVPFLSTATAAFDAASWVRRRPDLVTVANFPTGDHPLDIVLLQAAAAIRLGADHLDLVVPGDLVTERDWPGVTRFIRAVREYTEDSNGEPIAIKVILETAALDRERIRAVASAAIEAGANWLKTSTGFHPAGGATLHAVKLLRRIAPPEVGIKASGGIRTRELALAMLDAGADRIGTSAEKEILAAE